MKLGIISTHPIQYQVPLWRKLSMHPDLDVEVFYFSKQGLSGSIDPGFNRSVVWDLPLLEGYKYNFLSDRPIEESNAFAIPNIGAFMRGHKFDVILIHGYTYRFARQIITNKKQYGFKVILRGEFTEMSARKGFNWRKIPRRIYLKWFYRNVDYFCPIGIDAVNHLKKYGITKCNITLSPYSVDDQLFESKSKQLDKETCREILGIRQDETVFLFSGKMIPRKQPLLLADAVRKLYLENQNIVVIYLGSGPQYEDVKKRLEPKLGRKLIAPGFVNQSELGQYFKASDIFVLPSKYDTWGLVVNEAMHFGLPCIVSDRVGSRHDLVMPNETGFIFKSESVGGLVSCMQRFLMQPNLSVIMGEKAHSHIQNYTIEKTVNGIETAVHKVSQGIQH